MPMLRYRVGDLARFPRDSRPGAPTFTLEEVVGRELDRIRLSDGRWVHGAQFPHLMKDHPVREYQVTQRGDASVIVRVVPRPGFQEKSRAEIQQAVAANLPGLPVRLELVSAIPRTRANKLRPVVSEIDGPSRPVGG
jgi:phenylacetate-coenzyme A ligase PaaK-like adenylate-forming protein